MLLQRYRWVFEGIEVGGQRREYVYIIRGFVCLGKEDRGGRFGLRVGCKTRKSESLGQKVWGWCFKDFFLEFVSVRLGQM